MTQAKTTRKNKSQSVARKSAAKKMTASKIEPMNRATQSESPKSSKKRQNKTTKNIVEEKRYFTYMVRCADDTLYTGWTTDLRRRMRAHNGKIKGGAKYTKSRRPVKLVGFDAFDIKQEAQSREYAVKQLSREKKLALSANLDDGDKIDEANSL